MPQVVFDSLHIWFDKADPSDPNGHHYHLRTSWNERPFAFTRFPTNVHFVNHAPELEKYPLPKPRYLRIHAACAKVAFLSGATQYIEKVPRDVDEGYELAADGSSVDLLSHALLGLTPIGENVTEASRA